MIISDDSPLCRLPSELNVEQAAFLDGIRYSAAMIDLSYGRLKVTLHQLASEHPVNGCFAAAFQDAWSIIDSVHRLKQLLNKMPGMKRATSNFKLFARRTSNVKELRNRIQHLGDGMRSLAMAGSPVWGTLAWISVVELEPPRLCLCTLSAGRILAGEHFFPDPMRSTYALPVDHIALEAKPHKLEISDTVRNVEKLIRGLEKNLKKQFDGLPTQAADMVVKAIVELDTAAVISPET